MISQIVSLPRGHYVYCAALGFAAGLMAIVMPALYGYHGYEVLQSSASQRERVSTILAGLVGIFLGTLVFWRKYELAYGLAVVNCLVFMLFYGIRWLLTRRAER